MLGIQTQGGRMKGTEESTLLWFSIFQFPFPQEPPDVHQELQGCVGGGDHPGVQSLLTIEGEEHMSAKLRNDFRYQQCWKNFLAITGDCLLQCRNQFDASRSSKEAF